MLRVALTGNVASGKSTVARLWAHAGVPVIRADDLAREVVAPGSKGLAEVVEVFGKDILQADGSLDRGRLRDRVFRDPAERKRLETILHPRIRGLREEEVGRHRAEGHGLVVAEIPLLFEAGLQGDFDAVVLVVASREERLRRLVEDRGLREVEAMGIMEAQMPDQEKLSRTDYLLENDGGIQDLEIRAVALLDLLRARARKEAR